jgi:hypothetical protein
VVACAELAVPCTAVPDSDSLIYSVIMRYNETIIN